MISFIMKGYHSMKTRVDKYFSDIEEAPKRVSKNNELYESIKSSEISSFDVGTNARVIGENDSQINVDKIKEILEKNYAEPPKRTVIKDYEEPEKIELEKTKEYDINAILEKARAEKEVDYENERLKKIRDTQYDILKNLDLNEDKSLKSSTEKTKEELLDLINTINLNEQQTKQIKGCLTETKGLDPLDLLSDLKGDENTVVAGASELQDEILKAKNSAPDKTKKEIKEALDETLDKSFYTNSMSFDKKDFDESFFDDDGGASSVIVKILIFIVFIAIVAGIVIFLNEFLNLGWF